MTAGQGKPASAEAETGKTESPASAEISSDAGTEKPSDPNEELTFADPALEKAIRTSLGLKDDQPITRRIALGTEQLKLGGGGKEDSDKISDLSGLSEFLNLKVLEAPTNNISDIEELAGLTKLETDQRSHPPGGTVQAAHTGNSKKQNRGFISDLCAGQC